jgi:hypothetical protein
MSLKALAHAVLERHGHVHSAEQPREQAPEQSKARRCVICDAGLGDTYIAIWTGGNVCPTGPCVQRALDGADDEKETPKAVARYARDLSNAPTD